MKEVILVLLFSCHVYGGFMDRFNELYNRWSPGSGPYVFAKNDGQQLVTADQLLPDELLHQQILGPQLAAAGYSGAQIIAGPIAVPMKNLPRPPGLILSQAPAHGQQQHQAYGQQQQQAYAQQTQHIKQAHHQQPSQPAYPQQPVQSQAYQPPQNHHHALQHNQHAAHVPVQQAQPQQYQQHAVAYQAHPQHPVPQSHPHHEKKPVLKYQPPAQPTQYQPSGQPTQYQPPAQPTQYQLPAQPTQYKPAAQPTQYQQAAQPTQYQQAAQPAQYQQAAQPAQYQQHHQATHQQHHALPQRPTSQHQYQIPQVGSPQQQPAALQHYQQVQQDHQTQPPVYRPPQPTDAPAYRPLPAQHTAHSQPQYSVYKPLAPLPQQTVQHPRQPVYHKINPPRPATPSIPAYDSAPTGSQYPAQQDGTNSDALRTWSNSEWTPLPNQIQSDTATVPSVYQGSGNAVRSVSEQDHQAAAVDISDAELQNLNFHNVFDGVVPDIPDIPANFDISAFKDLKLPADGQIDPSLLALMSKNPQALAQLQGNSAQFAHLQGLHAQRQAAQVAPAAQARVDSPQKPETEVYKPEPEKLPAQGRSSEAPVRTDDETKVDLAAKKEKLKQKAAATAKFESAKPVVKNEPVKLKRRKVTNSTVKAGIRAPVSLTTTPASSSTEAPVSASTEGIITASWKGEKPHAVPRIGEGSGRFVGRVLPAEDVEVAPIQSAAQINEGVYLSNVGYSIKFTSRR